MSRILIIDDNKLVSMMLAEHLKLEGYDVELAEDANQGYAAAIEFQPDLILLDVQLPDVIGFDLIRIIKNREDLHDIPIMMITGTAHSTAEKVKGFQLGADDYVLKPFEMPELIERVKALLRRSKARPESSVSPAIPLEIAPDLHPEAVSPPKLLSMKEAVLKLLLDPFEFPQHASLPAVAMPFLMALLVLVLGGLALAAGETVKPAVAGIGVVGSWIILTSALVVTCSVSGIACSWREGGRLLGLAGVPMLLKMAGALVSTAWTTLSPFYFSAGLALIWPSAPFWACRLDLFELWSVFLVWVLILKRKESSPRRASIVTGVVWALAWALAAGLGRLGGS
jgi:DNA-binding response OmpR family regulator